MVAVAVTVSAQPPDPAPACRDGGAGIEWVSLAPVAEQTTLREWCESVGPPLVVTPALPPRATVALVVATWNVHVGGGDVPALIDWIRRQPYLRDRDVGLVLLLEETFRAGAHVPASYPVGLRVPKAIRPRRPSLDIAQLAASLGMHAAYVPSMRNGPSVDLAVREDRGNAILSTEPLSDLRAIELPLGRQRRVAIAATVAPSDAAPVRVVVLHLDTRARRSVQALALGRYLPRLSADGLPLIVGGDLNSLFGRRDQAFRLLDAAVPAAQCGEGRTNRWFPPLDAPFGWWRGRTDFMFDTLAAGTVHACETVRDAFGSDHRAVVMTIPLLVPPPFPG